MCLGMNPDILSPKERCASTSNRNFEGRQGAGGRTHLVSPVMAAAAAIVGKLTDVRALAPSKTGSVQKASPKFEVRPEMEDLDTDDDIERILDIPEDQDVGLHSAPTRASAGMAKFTTLKGIAAPMDLANVDTDAIIPKQFLKTIKRTGLGKALFNGWRYKEDGSEEPDFVLNREPYRQAKILVTGPNFGCGSSREHAPWALLDFGIKCVIAPSFADIFFNNTFKNGMLPIPITDQAALDKIADEARAGKGGRGRPCKPGNSRCNGERPSTLRRWLVPQTLPCQWARRDRLDAANGRQDPQVRNAAYHRHTLARW